jgi:hypothetical protein
LEFLNRIQNARVGALSIMQNPKLIEKENVKMIGDVLETVNASKFLHFNLHLILSKPTAQHQRLLDHWLEFSSALSISAREFHPMVDF